MRVKGFFFFLKYIVTDFLLSNYRLNDGNEYLFQAKDDVSFKILSFFSNVCGLMSIIYDALHMSDDQQWLLSSVLHSHKCWKVFCSPMSVRGSKCHLFVLPPWQES